LNKILYNKVSYISFIVPPVLTTGDNKFYIGRRGCPPVNIALLASVAEENSVDYQLIDALECSHITKFSDISNTSLQGMPLDEIVAKINKNTALIAITAMFTSEWLVVRKLTEKIKKEFPYVPIVIGGEHATADSNQIIKYEKTIDIVFKGESEISFDSYLKNSHVSLEHVPGIVYRDIYTSSVVSTDSPQRILDIDNISPSWKKVNLNYYLDNKLSYSELGKRTMPVVSSRGCPYKCTFCSNYNMWGTRYVTRSVDSVINELSEYIEKYKVEHFDFIDLATSVKRGWFKNLLENMIEKLPPVSWEMTVGTRSEILDDEVLQLIYDSGSRVISYAPETGAKSMAKKIKKQVDFKKMYSSIRSAVKIGFVVKANMIIGFPDETPRELFATLIASIKLGWYGVKGVTILTYQPFLGTELSQGKYNEMTYEDYNNRVLRLSAREGVGVFNIFNVFKTPKVQLYNFISNSVMIVSYFAACVRNPREPIISFRNILNGEPIGALEVAIYSMLKRKDR
jgi:radical SAM superfamily enzyme YgiQ (UPF0313 family)